LARFEPVAEQSAAYFYAKLFELDPEAERLFARTDMDAQGKKVMRMFAEIVRTLDQPGGARRRAGGPGRRHAHYGVRDSQYDSVGTALLWTLGAGSARPSPRRCGTRVDRGLPPAFHRPAAGGGPGTGRALLTIAVTPEPSR
jgi:hypothetical protein